MGLVYKDLLRGGTELLSNKLEKLRDSKRDGLSAGRTGCGTGHRLTCEILKTYNSKSPFRLDFVFSTILALLSCEIFLFKLIDFVFSIVKWRFRKKKFDYSVVEELLLVF